MRLADTRHSSIALKKFHEEEMNDTNIFTLLVLQWPQEDLAVSSPVFLQLCPFAVSRVLSPPAVQVASRQSTCLSPDRSSHAYRVQKSRVADLRNPCCTSALYL